MKRFLPFTCTTPPQHSTRSFWVEERSGNNARRDRAMQGQGNTILQKQNCEMVSATSLSSCETAKRVSGSLAHSRSPKSHSIVPRPSPSSTPRAHVPYVLIMRRWFFGGRRPGRFHHVMSATTCHRASYRDV